MQKRGQGIIVNITENDLLASPSWKKGDGQLRLLFSACAVKRHLLAMLLMQTTYYPYNGTNSRSRSSAQGG